MQKVKGFYKKHGKTRPITEKKRKSTFHRQTEEPSWKQNSINDLKDRTDNQPSHKRIVKIVYNDGSEETVKVQAPTEEMAIQHVAIEKKSEVKNGAITSLASGGTVAPSSAIAEAIKEPEGTIFGGPFGMLGPQWPWIKGYKGDYFERSKAWSRDMAKGNKKASIRMKPYKASPKRKEQLSLTIDKLEQKGELSSEEANQLRRKM